MALVDVTQAITTSFNDISYTAGEEPWNKNIDLFVIDSKDTNQSSYQCDWKKWHGIYRTIAEARSTIDVQCRWIIGKKLIMDNSTDKMLKRIKGIGIDTLRKILLNIKRVSKIGGDCFSEKIKDKAGRLINLKVLNPGTIKIEADDFGIIKSYKQVSSTNATSATVLNEWSKEKGNIDEIWHHSNERIADEIHGIPELEKLYNILVWRHQSMNDLAVVFHRYVQPILEIYAKTDDPDELAALKSLYDKASKFMENRIIPSGAIDKVERVSIPQYSTLDPLPWMIFLRSYWTESSGVPDLIRGKSDEVSLAAGKLNYVGFKERIIYEQLEFSEEIESQLGLKIEFEAPVEIDIEIAKTNDNMNDKRTAKENKVVVSGKAP